MCMSRPGRVLQVREGAAEVDTAGRRAWFNALLVPELRPGCWVLTHTSLVLSEISENEAEEINALLREGMEVAR